MKSRKDHYLETQKLKFATRQISRRRFISSVAAAGVTIPTAMGWASRVEAATPNKGGHFRLGMAHGSTTDSLDPATFENSLMTQTGYTYGNHLTEVRNTGELGGDLAEGWEASEDAKTWMFKLRQGVEFHNGKTLTADDVIASINYHRGEDSKSAAKSNVSGITDIRADGDTVVFELSSGNADFPYLLSDYHLVIMPSDGGEVDPTSGIGTGPYKIDSFEPGVKVMGTRFENYFKEDRAHFDSVEYLSIVDLTARQNALLNDEVDAIDRVDPKTVALLARAPHIDIMENTGTLHYTAPMRVDAVPFDNYDLRMALKYAVKRQELVDKILLGHGAVGNDVPLSTANSQLNSGMDQREFDPEKAAEHYAKSGHSGTIQLSASDAAFAGAVDAAQLIAASAAEAGIDVEVVREPTDGYWSNVWNKKPWCMCYWGGRPTADWMFSSAYTSDTEWNDTAWRTGESADQFNELVVQARSELDDTKRQAMYDDAQVLLNDDGGALIPMFANLIEGLNKRLAHDENVAANWEQDGNKSHERWWFA